VLVTISDRKIQNGAFGGAATFYTADVKTANDYYPFGMAMPSRTFASSASTKFRYGFNGKENDPDISAGIQDYGMRIYDARLGRFLSVDPLKHQFPMLSTYQSSGCNPIKFIDLDGGEPKIPPLPGMEGMIVHAPKLGGPDAGKILLWAAVNGQWVSSYFPVRISPSGIAPPDQSIYSGPTTYYDVAEITTGIPSGTQYSGLNIEYW
jgi:RHS repeat-associated protein